MKQEEIQWLKHKHDVVVCLENSAIIVFSGYFLYSYRGLTDTG
jgi:hypothetical protein